MKEKKIYWVSRIEDNDIVDLHFFREEESARKKLHEIAKTTQERRRSDADREDSDTLEGILAGSVSKVKTVRIGENRYPRSFSAAIGEAVFDE